MLPGIDEILANLIYIGEYFVGLLLWNIARVLLAVAHFIQNVQAGLLTNVAEFVQYTVNALSAPVGALLVLALAAMGVWYALNNIVATSKWVDPSRLVTYGLATLVFFSSPVLVVNTLESIRTSLTQGIEATILDNAIADMFNMETGAEDDPLPDSIPDINNDGIIGSFDLAAYFLSISNSFEIYNGNFPSEFAAAYFPDHPTEVDLSNEDVRNEAIEDGWAGITRLLFSFVAIPTAIAENFLWFVLTIAALFLYIGFPIAASLSFFVYTDALFTAYVRQFIKLCIETFISVIIVSFVVGLIAAASQASIGLFIGTCLIGTVILLWRIKGALKLSTAAFDVFGGGALTGGATGKDFRNTVTAAGVAAVAAATGGSALMAAGALSLDSKAGGKLGTGETSLMGLDQAKHEARTQQLMSLAGYGAGKIPAVREGIETAHEGRSFLRAMRDGGPKQQDADALDYARAGSALSTFGTSPWLAMRSSPSLRRAFDNIGGGSGYAYRAEDGAAVAGAGPDGNPLAAVLQQLMTVLQGMQPGTNGSGEAHRAARQGGQTGTGSGDGGDDNHGADGGESAPPPDRKPPPPPNYPPDAQDPDRGGAPQAGRGFEGSLPPATRDGAGTAVSGGPAPAADAMVGANRGQGGDGLAERFAGQVVDPTAAAPPETGPVIIQSQSEERTAAMARAVGDLADPASVAGQSSQQALVMYTGQENAAALQLAVGQHGPEAVQAATRMTAAVVKQYQAEEMDDAAILNMFQSGAGFAAVRAQLAGDTPLNAAQLTAVADMVMMPRREVSPEAFTRTLATMAAAGGDREAAAAFGASNHFAQYTGAVRGVMAGAQEMGLSQEQIVQVLGNIQQGLMVDVRAALHATGAAPTTIQNFISDASMLPAGRFQIAQSAAPQEDASS